jgi:hypothetical protein
MRALACAAIALVTIAVSGPTAFGQAGSTGGTLGNTDKSISGNREEPRQSAEPPRRHSEPRWHSRYLGHVWRKLWRAAR